MVRRGSSFDRVTSSGDLSNGIGSLLESPGPGGGRSGRSMSRLSRDALGYRVAILKRDGPNGATRSSNSSEASC